MAFTARHNITTALTQNLVSAGDDVSVKSVNLSNVHASTSVGVDLVLNTSSGDHYIIKNTIIPSGATLNVDVSDINVDTSTDNDSLRIKLSAAIPVDVLVNI